MPNNAEVASSMMDDAYQAIRNLTRGTDNSDAIGRIHQELDTVQAVLDKAAAAGEEITEERARAHYLRGQLLCEGAHSEPASTDRKHQRHMLELALENFQKALTERPSPKTHYNAGICHANLGRKEEALQALKESAKLAEEWGETQVGLDAQKMIAKMESEVVSKSSGGCYIATACYGSYDHPDVIALRRFRDERLMASALGRLFVNTYYVVSPCLARRLVHTSRLARFIRCTVLEPLVRRWRDG